MGFKSHDYFKENQMQLNIKSDKKENYPLIDIFKFICAIFVVIIHTNIMSDVNNTMQWYIMCVVLKLAVPFFFITSGFLFGKKYLENKNKLKENSKKQIKRLLIPFIFWSSITLLYVFLIMDKTGNIIFNILKTVYRFIFNPYHLWFVSALIVAIYIEYFFLKKGKVKLAIALSIVLYIIAMLGNSYYFLLENLPIKVFFDMLLKIIIVIKNGIFVGFPLFTIGILVAYKEKIIKNISKSKLYILLIIFVITQIMEATFIRGKNYEDDYSIFISTIFITTILLMFCIKYDSIKLRKINTKILRNLSTGIYYMHFPICRYIKYFIPDLNLWILFVATIVLSIVLDMVLLKIDNKYINLLIE